jgi:hypothetical protein
MPLAWAHAEFIKLVVSRDLGRPFDRPRATWERYKGKAPSAKAVFWWPHARIGQFAVASRVVVALPQPGTIRWGIDGWQAITETSAEEMGLGFYAATLNTSEMPIGSMWILRSAEPPATGPEPILIVEPRVVRDAQPDAAAALSNALSTAISSRTSRRLAVDSGTVAAPNSNLRFGKP